jgi:hypothetical protein
MTVKIVQEVTDWRVPYRQPNHVYLMSGDRVLAMSRWGEGRPEYFANPGRMDRRGRKFVEVKRNPWRFDLRIAVESEPEQRPKGQTWTVSGSKGNQYTVSQDSGRWSCTCPGHGFRGRCRHVDEVSASIQQSV